MLTMSISLPKFSLRGPSGSSRRSTQHSTLPLVRLFRGADIRNKFIIFRLFFHLVLPGFVFGPYGESCPKPSSAAGLGTNGMILGLISGAKVPQPPPFIVDVRDVAKAHVLALKVLPNPKVEAKRYIVNGGNLTWRDAVEHLNEVHPKIKTAEFEENGEAATLDTKNTVEELNFGPFIDPKDTIVAAAEALIALQKTWT